LRVVEAARSNWLRVNGGYEGSHTDTPTPSTMPGAGEREAQRREHVMEKRVEMERQNSSWIKAEKYEISACGNNCLLGPDLGKGCERTVLQSHNV